jgi:hypothetical protein
VIKVRSIMKNLASDTIISDYSLFKKAFILFMALCMFFVFAPHKAEAAIAFDAKSNSTPNSTNVTSDSWTHITGSGLTNSILIIGVSWRNGGSSTYGVSSITYGGSSAGINHIRTDGQDGGTGSRRTALYYLLNPGSGSKTIQVNFTGQVYVAQGGAVTFEGVDQTTPIGVHNGQVSDTEDPVNVTVNTAYANNYVVDIVCIRENTNVPDGTPEVGSPTELFTFNSTATGYGLFTGMSYKGPNSSGDVTMQWDITLETLTSMSAAELNPASSNATPNSPTITNYNTGASTSDNTPTLNFTQDDPDSGEQVQYQIQIDGTDNTFTNLVVDYTSDYMAEGATSFTVGQAEGSGTYTVGSQGQTLSDGSYYWRVKSIDDDAAESSWANANSGSIAFEVNTAATTQAIKIQRGTADVPKAGATQTAPADFIEFGSLTSAFVLNKNNQFGSAGASTADSNSKYIDDTSLLIELTATDTITFTRDGNSDDQDYRADWESWEYIGSPGGPNEFIVRSRNTVTLSSSERSKTVTLDNSPDNIDRCIPFITGILHTYNNYRFANVTAIAWLSGTNTLNVERGGEDDAVTVQVVTVEFTGSNWRVAHGLNTGYTADTGTITLVEEAAGTGTTFTINDTNRAFIAATQHRSTERYEDATKISDNYPVTYISSTTQISFAHDSTHGPDTNQKLMVHVLENPGLSVWRTADTQSAAGDNNVDITAAGVTDLSNTAVFATGATAGLGIDNPRGRRNYRLTSTTNLAHWCTRSGNDPFEHRIEIVTMPMDTGWYSDSCWEYRKKLTLNAGLVEADQTDFPVLISFTGDSDLAAGAQSDFDDVLFTSADGTTKLSHEIEDYDSANGDLVAWVKIPFLSSSVDTEIYMYYG